LLIAMTGSPNKVTDSVVASIQIKIILQVFVIIMTAPTLWRRVPQLLRDGQIMPAR